MGRRIARVPDVDMWSLLFYCYSQLQLSQVLKKMLFTEKLERTARQIFLILHTRTGFLNLAKITFGDFSKNFSFSKFREKVPKTAQNRTFSDFSQIWLQRFSLCSATIQKVLLATVCRKPYIRENSGSGVTVPKLVKSTYFRRRISREEVKQIGIRFDFRKGRSCFLRKCLRQYFTFSTPSPRKLSSKFGPQKGHKNGVQIFSSLGVRIWLEFCTILEVYTGLIW